MAYLKIPTSSLKPGMYVARLDRSWLETPFPFQGFVVETGGEIEEFRRLCRHVYIDADRSRAEMRRDEFPEAEAADQDLDGPAGREAFRHQVNGAADTREVTRRQIRRVLTDLRLGRHIDVDNTRFVVTKMVDSIVRYRDASIWLTQLKNQDEYTCLHCLNVCVLTVSFCHYLGYSKTDLETIGLGALLHDVGKALTPPELLNKPDALTPEELQVLRRHPEDGYRLMVSQTNLPEVSLSVIRHHHERINGQGYPKGLDSDELHVPILATAVCDVYDAITSDRSYSRAQPADRAVQMMQQQADRTFGGELMHNFVKCIGIYPVGSMVELNNGCIGLVVSAPENNRLKPRVLVVSDQKHQAIEQRALVDLARMAGEPNGEEWQIHRLLAPSEAPLDARKVVISEAFDTPAVDANLEPLSARGL